MNISFEGVNSRDSRHNCADFLALQWHITQQHWPAEHLWELRKQIEIELLKSNRNYNSFDKFFAELKLSQLHKETLNSELLAAFLLLDTEQANFQNFTATPYSIVSVQLQPAFWQTEFWKTEGSLKLHNMLSRKPDNCQILRSGYLSSEAEILESASLGFDGLVWHLENKDHFEIQYGIEIGRDLKLNIIPIAKTEEELDLLLKTDAPYIGIWALESEAQKLNLPFLQKMSVKIPNNCLKFIITGPDSQTITPLQMTAFKTWGYKAILF